MHIDVKKLGRIQGGAGRRVRGGAQHYNPTVTDTHGKRRNTVGWEYVHVAIDDYSRLAYAEVLADEKAVTAIGFLRRAVAFYPVTASRSSALLTDNGSAYRSTIHALACRALGIRHLRTRPYRPQTNGKAERFIRTLLAGWAYGAIYRSSSERTAALDGWLWHYNHRRTTLSPRPPTPDHQNQPARVLHLGGLGDEAPHFRDERLLRKRLSEHGPAGRRGETILRAAHQQYRQVGVDSPQPLSNGVAADPGHQHVEHCKAHLVLLDGGDRREARARGDDLVALVFQRRAQQLREDAVVVGDENRRGHAGQVIHCFPSFLIHCFPSFHSSWTPEPGRADDRRLSRRTSAPLYEG